MLGRWRLAILTQIILALTIIALCWSRLVFEPWAIKISLGVIAFIYLASTAACLVSKTLQTPPWLKTFGFILVCSGGLATGFVFKQHWLGVGVYFVPSNSMSPTLNNGDFFIGDTWLYKDRSAETGDVIVFIKGDHKFTKRIFALEGEHVTLNGTVAVKSQLPLEATVLLVGRNEAFVLGDNSMESRDSRHFGPIPMGYVHAKAMLKLFSIQKEEMNFTDFGYKL